MTADMLFIPALPQKPPSSFQSDKTGSFSSDPSSKTEQQGLAKSDNQENFLTTLKKLSQDRISSGKLRLTVLPSAAQAHKTDRQPKNEQLIDHELAGDEAMLDIMSLIGNDETSLNDQPPVAAEAKELLTLLEEWGPKGLSGEQLLLPGSELAIENRGHPDGKPGNRLAALKQMIGDLQPNDRKPGDESSSGLERLRRFIANPLTSGNSVHGGSKPEEGLNLSQTAGSVDLSNGITREQKNAGSISSAMTGEGAGSEKSAEILSTITKAAMETAPVPKESGSAKGVENPPIPLTSENLAKTDTAKLNTLMQAGAEADETSKDNKVHEKVPGNANGPVNHDEAERTLKAGDSNRSAYFSRSLSSADSGRHSGGGEAPQEKFVTGDSSPVSKFINDAQVEKESAFKAATAHGDDAGSKVVKIEAGPHDSGQLTSQPQSSEKANATMASPKEAEAGQRELRTQTMEQIVRRAVIQVRDGQHEARIDLKPDFMGHVRMQVITENQQVTVKILTEFGFVKDLIENNIHQLKADLQQQGLEVDKLDVSVSRDSHDNKHRQENGEHARNLRHQDKSSDRGNTRDEHREPTHRAAAKAEGLSTVDYFA